MARESQTWIPGMLVVVEPADGAAREMVWVRDHLEAAVLRARGYAFPRTGLRRTMADDARSRRWERADG